MKYEYEGPLQITHYSDQWGNVYLDAIPYRGFTDLGTIILE